jgi:hypothetical protein
MFFPTSMIALMVPFRNFSFLDFLADRLQKSISVASTGIPRYSALHLALF